MCLNHLLSLIELGVAHANGGRYGIASFTLLKGRTSQA